MNDLSAKTFFLLLVPSLPAGTLPAQQSHEQPPAFAEPQVLEVRGGEGVYALHLGASGCWLSVQQEGTEKVGQGHWTAEGTLTRGPALWAAEPGRAGALAVFPAGGRCVLTHSQEAPSSRGIVELGLYFAERDSAGWSLTEAFPFNDPEFSNLHPALSGDGRTLVFASNRPGGFGGFDLYVSFLRPNGWSRPVNLGPEVNSPANEAYPFLAPDGKLYFASDAPRNAQPPNFDLYFAIPTDPGFWAEKRPLGPPFNSPADDFNFLTTPTHTFFISNRAGSDRLFRTEAPPED